jgi:hypothetical protein
MKFIYIFSFLVLSSAYICQIELFAHDLSKQDSNMPENIRKISSEEEKKLKDLLIKSFVTSYRKTPHEYIFILEDDYAEPINYSLLSWLKEKNIVTLLSWSHMGYGLYSAKISVPTSIIKHLNLTINLPTF